MAQQQLGGERLLGEVIEVERGKVTSRRIIDAEKMKIEHNFASTSKLKGVEGTNMGKYVSQAQPDGTLYGEGEGIFMSQEGESVSWKGHGIGVFTGPGKIRFRGSVIYNTQSKGKLASMNNVFGVFEHFGDMEGEMTSTVWEWK